MDVNYQPARLPKFRMEWIGEAWRYFQEQAGTWIVSALIVFVVSTIARSIFAGIFRVPVIVQGPNAWHTNPALFGQYYSLASPGNDALSLIGLVINSFFYCGAFYMSNSQVRGRPIAPGMLFQNLSVFLNMLGYSLLSSLAIGIGLVLCIFPGIIAAALLWPGFALVADGVPVGDALSRSINTARNDLGTGFLFVLVFGLIILLSMIPCFLGLFVTIPMGWIIGSLMYRDMIGMPAGGAVDTAMPYGASPQPGVWPPSPGYAAAHQPTAYPGSADAAVTPPEAVQPAPAAEPPAAAYPPPASPYGTAAAQDETPRPVVEPQEGDGPAGTSGPVV